MNTKRDLRHYPNRYPPLFNGAPVDRHRLVPRPIRIEGDAVRLQTALLDARTNRPPAPLLQRIWNYLWS
jgi:hypothetical protein